MNFYTTGLIGWLNAALRLTLVLRKYLPKLKNATAPRKKRRIWESVMIPDHEFSWLMHLEGVESNLPGDPGGFTKYGISIKFAGSAHLDFDEDGKTTNHDLQIMDREQARAVYQQYFWDIVRCTEMPPAFAWGVFEGGVNQGPKTVVMCLQRALGVLDDGRVGKETLSSLHYAGRTTFLKFMDERWVAYTRALTFSRYGHGFRCRLDKSLLFAGAKFFSLPDVSWS